MRVFMSCHIQCNYIINTILWFVLQHQRISFVSKRNIFMFAFKINVKKLCAIHHIDFYTSKMNLSIWGGFRDPFQLTIKLSLTKFKLNVNWIEKFSRIECRLNYLFFILAGRNSIIYKVFFFIVKHCNVLLFNLFCSVEKNRWTIIVEKCFYCYIKN